MRYAITDLSAKSPIAPLDAAGVRRLRWAADLRRWAAEDVDFVQLREKTLDAGEVFSLARSAMQFLADLGHQRRPRLLVNGRADLAAAARADGVHLTSRSGELRPEQVREVFRASGLAACTVSVSCHTPAGAVRAREHGADLVLFGPVFEKRVHARQVAPGHGLEGLRRACEGAAPVPVLALGGIDESNTPECLRAGAAGIAGIRLFADPSIVQ